MKYLMTLMMSALLVSTTTAQEKKGEVSDTKSRAEMMAERMTKELGLDADQKTKVQAITLKYEEKAAGRTSARADKEVAPDKEGALSEMNGSLKNVLTPAQYEKWQKIRSAAPSTDKGENTIQELKKTE